MDACLAHPSAVVSEKTINRFVSRLLGRGRCVSCNADACMVRSVRLSRR